MAKNRIKIEGVWYIKEEDNNDFDPTYFKGIVVEDHDVCLEATFIYKDRSFEFGYVDDTASIKISYKNSDGKKEEFIDNPSYLRKMLKKGKVKKDLLPSSSHDMMLQLCKELDKLGWI